ncbi:hypothetical protein AB0G73_00505 [Streptomyces sp. NPDC020719]
MLITAQGRQQGRPTAITMNAHGHLDDPDSADAFIPPGEELRQV